MFITYFIWDKWSITVKWILVPQSHSEPNLIQLGSNYCNYSTIIMKAQIRILMTTSSFWHSLLPLATEIQCILPLLVRESLSSLVVNHAWLTAETSSLPKGDISSSCSFCRIFKRKKKKKKKKKWQLDFTPNLIHFCNILQYILSY